MPGLADTLKKNRSKSAPPLAAALKKKLVNGVEKKTGLAATLAKKKGKATGLAGLKQKHDKQKAASSKLDFTRGGIRFHNAKVRGEITAGHKSGIGRYWGEVDVSNGDMTFTLHNKYGSWMAEVNGGRMAEPARVAMMLGTSVSQLDMYRGLAARFEAELKSRGFLTPTERRRQLEAEEAEKRKRLAKLEADREKRKAKKSTKEQP